jgi:gamma-glutamylcysteine synthetase
MDFKEKHYIECSLSLLIEVDKKNREKIMKKLNGIISSALKDEKVIQLSKNINLISEHDIMLSMASYDPSDIN